MLTTQADGRTWNFSHAIGRNAAAGNGFTNPISVAAAPGGLLYVLSRGAEAGVQDNKRIGKLTIDEEFISDFGRGELTWPNSLAVAADGNVYISDEFDNYVAVYNPDGERLTKFGETGSGDGQLGGPAGLAFDSDDNLYVVDAGNNRVQKFTTDGRHLLNWGRSGAGDGELNHPWGITIDRQGDVYVADWGNSRVQKFSPDGTFLMSIGAPNGSDELSLDHPSDVAVDSDGDIYVIDWGNKRVLIYDPEGEVLTTLQGDAHEFSKWASVAVASNPDAVKAYRRVKDTTALARFQRPTGIAVDEQDRIIITETTRGRLQVYSKDKDYLDPQFNL